MSTPTTTTVGTVHVSTRGDVAAADVDHARQKVAAALRVARDPVLLVRVRLTQLPDPALERPSVAEVRVDLEGRPVRAQVARQSMREAVDEVHDRLFERLSRSARDWQAIRGRRPSPEPHEWRHSRPATERPSYFPRPAEEREVVRHKAFSVRRATVEEAAFDMAMLDYHFFLFTEDGSGVDSVLYRPDPDSDLRLAQLDPQPDRVTPGETVFSTSPHPAPELTQTEAVDRLNLTGWPFVFYRDAATGRGALLYHRYDGHYGLLVPAD